MRQSTTIGRLGGRKHDWLITGIKPKTMTTFYLVALASDAPIRAEIGKMRNQLWGFAAVAALISVFLGVILSQRFLVPIRDLAQGVEAIQVREFKHRVPFTEGDELGDLARTFNSVMEGLSDLEVARIVQESLFPSGKLIAGAFEVYGTSRSSSELGGDYFDLQQLHDGRVLVLIGDVSGHGVPSALVMAMAKALVERESETNPHPVNLLEVVHRILFRTLKRKRMMTCFLALLDPPNRLLTYSNAGHNFPILYRDGEEPRFLENKSFPLGSVKRNRFTPDDLILQPGDRLLLYTDGLVEAKMGDEMIGYNRMSKVVRQFLHDDAQASCEAVVNWHIGLTGDGPQEDDITLVLLSCRADADQPIIEI